MTEPRKPEAVPEDEVPARLEQDAPAPDTGVWRPVDPEPDPAAPEPVAEPEPVAQEPVAEPEPVAQEPVAEPEPAAPEPVAEEPVAEPGPVAPEPAAEQGQAADERPIASRSAVAAQPDEPVGATAAVPEPVEAPEPVSEPREGPESVPEPVEAPQPVPAHTDASEAVTEPIPPGAPSDGIFRPASPTSAGSEPTRVEGLSDEEQRLAAERAARRDARTAALAAAAPAPLVAPAPVILHTRTNDKFWGSLGLFLLRIVLAGIFAIRGLNILTDIPTAQAQFAKTIIPEPEIMAIVTGVAAELIALSLLLGLLTRVAGLGIALIAGGALTFVYWGPWSPFLPGQPGFLGEYELLLATVGLLLLLIGGGGWSLDRSFRSGRERDKRERTAGDA